MTEENAPAGGAGARGGDSPVPKEATVIPGSDNSRLPCRTTKGCSGTRPVVLVGCAAGFDRCVKCYRRRLGRAA
jgi:hypothetical protein